MPGTDILAPSTPLNDVPAWIRLEQTPGVGPATASLLLDAFGSPAGIFAAPHAALAAVVGETIAAALAAAPASATQDGIARALDWAARPGNTILSPAGADYPAALRHLAAPPLLLYARGDVAWLARMALAIVGARNASEQGKANGAAFAQDLSGAGLTIVSGLALGIDGAAHGGGLLGAGSTVAVLGTGIDIVYPRRHAALAAAIAERGCLISEYPLGTPVRAENFPRRNRLISGLARGVLVVEAALQSGSLITARYAADQGREVFAIPGSIHATLSRGCHQLIKEGAKLVETSADVLQELGWGLTPAAAAPGAGRDPVLRALGHDPVDADTLARRSGLDAAELAARLLALEMAGRVERLPGGRYQSVR